MDETAQEIARWEFEATKIFFKLKNSGEPFNADDYYREARALAMPPQLIRKFSSLFKTFKASGYIATTKEYRLSTRNNSSPLPLYIGKKEPLVELQNPHKQDAENHIG